MSIKDNYLKIIEEMGNACNACGRKAEDVMLLAVTKTRSAVEINEAIDLGIQNIGENKVQELLSKHEDIKKDAIIHFIGQLQNNKVKYIIDKVQYYHSLDRISLAEELDKRAKARNVTVKALIEINTTRMEGRGGIVPQQLDGFLEELARYNNISVCGLMTVAPNTEEQYLQRQCFAQMYKLFEHTKDELGSQIQYLSMGMSNDFKAAILEGSNIIRIGSALFGSRY